jgi:hypothetical protein
VVDSADRTRQLNDCTIQIFSLKRTSFFHVIESLEKLIIYERINENPMAPFGKAVIIIATRTA